MGSRWKLIAAPWTVASFNKTDLSDTNGESAKYSTATTEGVHVSKQKELPNIRFLESGKMKSIDRSSGVKQRKGYAWVRVDA
jgi:hypothetical protein